MINPIFVSIMLSLPERIYNLRGIRFIQTNANTKTFVLNTLCYEGDRIFNMIPEHNKAINHVHRFKSKMKLWSVPEFHCRNCVLCYIYRF